MLPVTLIGLTKILSKRYAGRTILALYLVPTLLIALIYRTQWSFSLHIICLYHAFILFLVIAAAGRARVLFLTLRLAAIGLEGILCVLFLNIRFLPVRGLRLDQLTAGTNSIYLAIYLALGLLILGIACREMRRVPLEPESKESPAAIRRGWLLASGKVLLGLSITALVIAAYSLSCLRFY